MARGIFGMVWAGLLLVCLAWPGTGAALEVPSTEAKCINDHGNMLSKKDEARFKSLCDKARKDGVEMMIVTVKSLEDYSVRPSRLDFLVDNLFDEWDIEYDAASSAILVFASRKERQVRLRMGDHFPDKSWKKAERIIKRSLGPSVARRSSAGIMPRWPSLSSRRRNARSWTLSARGVRSTLTSERGPVTG